MLTGIVLTRNEEKNIGECLEALKFCDEIIVVDDYSTDNTAAIAKKRGARVIKRRLNNDFASQRNYGLRKAKPGWVLFIDADERVSPILAKQIICAIKSQEKAGYYLSRRDILFGNELRYGETGNIKLLRLARRDAGRWRRKVHETWEVKGKTGELDAPLIHYPHKSLTDFLRDINRYSRLHAEAFYAEHKKSNLFQIIAFPAGKFCQNYLWRLGFLDGMPGLIMALMMSLHSFLARGKLYLLWKKGPPEYF